MALFKCKMCGGDLEISEGVSIAECEYCGTKQTVPKVIDENLQNLFNRANTLRIKSEFDKAEKLYEKIIQADSTQADAYWGLILCKYGIEYVDDPATYKKIPTCHRASYDSIVADDDYKSALEYADMAQRAIYEEQAREIDRIQKEILALAQNEEKYDVFICYKETDADGKRTQDSVIANDIYHQLTQEGFKVFYAAITLEGKLGSAYEPIIFAALNSAKVMLAIGTKPEYFNAVWVKNEWSRFLKIIKQDRSKLLIPCYRNMDAYELPEEFAHLQAQDMSKIGFINDVVRGIKKVIKKDEPKATVVKETVVTTANSNIAPLLKRAYMFLEDEEWKNADEYAEKVLDMDPENAEAYLVKFLADTETINESSIVEDFEESDYLKDSADFQKALRFADDKLRERLNGYIKTIDDRFERNRLEGIYGEARSKMKLNTYTGYSEAAKLFKSINAYLDSRKLNEECLEKAEVCRKQDIYHDAIRESSKSTVESVSQAIKLYKSISGWKDADEQTAKCEAKLLELKEKEEKERIQREQEAEEKRNKKEKIIIFTVASCVVLLTLVLGIPFIKYELAQEYMAQHKYGEALNLFDDLQGYKNADELYDNAYCMYNGDYGKIVKKYNLTEFVVPDGVTSIDNYAFSNCTSLTSIVIPDSVTSIGYRAFAGCTSLTSIVIPDSVTRIEAAAFYKCHALVSVTFENVDGWMITISNQSIGEQSISSMYLSDSARAAKFLASTYSSYYWNRSE